MDLSQHVEPGELLEDCWFFGNLLHKQPKSRMLRSFSDPCSSFNFPGKSYQDTYESINKVVSSSPSSSSPPRRDGTRTVKERRSRNSLVRAPSLPTTLETEAFHDEEEREFSMGKLIRQASLNYSDTRPPRTSAPKSSSITRQKAEVNKLMTQKSLKDVDAEELQGLKDLGLDFDENVVPGLQEKTNHEEKRSARAYASEAPPVPRWGGKRSTEDMKAQIKFWARAVASNVRQEC